MFALRDKSRLYRLKTRGFVLNANTLIVFAVDVAASVAYEIIVGNTEVPNLENEAPPQNRPSPPTAQLGNGRELKFCMNSLLVNTNNNAEAIF